MQIRHKKSPKQVKINTFGFYSYYDMLLQSVKTGVC